MPPKKIYHRFVCPAGVQLDVSHAHAQRQETVHVPRLRQGILPELRPEETSAETSRRAVPSAAGHARRRPGPRIAGRPAAAARRAARATARPRRAVSEPDSARSRPPVRPAAVNAGARRRRPSA